MTEGGEVPVGCPKFRKEFDYTKPDNYSVHKALNNLAHANGQDESCPYECRVNHKQNRSDNITPTVVTAFMLSGNAKHLITPCSLFTSFVKFSKFHLRDGDRNYSNYNKGTPLTIMAFICQLHS